MRNIVEGAEKGDLARLVNPVLSIDEYRSKMGDDKDVVVLSMTVFGQEPAEDLVNFIEKSYDFVLDADISSGETGDGNYVMFVEIERRPAAIDHIMDMMTDIMNLTDQKLSDWKFTYYKDSDKYDLTSEELTTHVIVSPKKYDETLARDQEQEVEESRQLNHLRAISGIKVQPQKTTNLAILDMQIAAGIR